jgi:hypothetical protein
VCALHVSKLASFTQAEKEEINKHQTLYSNVSNEDNVVEAFNPYFLTPSCRCAAVPTLSMGTSRDVLRQLRLGGPSSPAPSPPVVSQPQLGFGSPSTPPVPDGGLLQRFLVVESTAQHFDEYVKKQDEALKASQKALEVRACFVRFRLAVAHVLSVLRQLRDIEARSLASMQEQLNVLEGFIQTSFRTLSAQVDRLCWSARALLELRQLTSHFGRRSPAEPH